VVRECYCRNSDGRLRDVCCNPPRIVLHVLPDKHESKSSGNGKHEITEQQKNHQSRQLIGFCHLSLHRPSLAYHRALWRGRLIEKGRDAKKTITAEEFGKFMADEYKRWNAVREAAGISQQ
jgi:hypothetical protein